MEVIFSVFMIAILIFVAIRPTLTNLAVLQKKITDKESVSLKADKKIGQLFSAQEQIDANGTSLSLFETAVPEKFSYLELIGRFEVLAKKNSVEVEAISIQGTNLVGEGKGAGDWSTKLIKVDSQGLMTIPIDFQILGKPQEIRSFLVDLENVDRLAVIKNVNLIKDSGGSKGTERLKANGQVNFYVYYQKK
ncbi:MAG: hypothetical protein ACD_57C00303G0001 [uncultured bacterium]|nr:MAG: hypothetical protein ACD_57C00303G0001 [uncultured bacterium]